MTEFDDPYVAQAAPVRSEALVDVGPFTTETNTPVCTFTLEAGMYLVCIVVKSDAASTGDIDLAVACDPEPPDSEYGVTTNPQDTGALFGVADIPPGAYFILDGASYGKAVFFAEETEVEITLHADGGEVILERYALGVMKVF